MKKLIAICFIALSFWGFSQSYRIGFDEVYHTGADGLSKGQGRTQADNVKSSYAFNQKDKLDTLTSKFSISLNPSVVFGRELLRLPIFVPRLLKPGFGTSISFERKLSSAIALRVLASINRAFYLGDRGFYSESRFDYLGFGFGLGIKILEIKKHYFSINADFLPSNVVKSPGNHNGKFGLLGKLQAQYLYKLSKKYEIGATSSASYSIIQFPGPPPLYNGHIASYFDFGLIFKRNF